MREKHREPCSRHLSQAATFTLNFTCRSVNTLVTCIMHLAQRFQRISWHFCFLRKQNHRNLGLGEVPRSYPSSEACVHRPSLMAVCFTLSFIKEDGKILVSASLHSILCPKWWCGEKEPRLLVINFGCLLATSLRNGETGVACVKSVLVLCVVCGPFHLWVCTLLLWLCEVWFSGWWREQLMWGLEEQL